VRKRGLRAARGRGEAIGGVFRGGAGLEWRVHGGPELAGVQWSVVVFWDVEAAKERGYQWNRVRG